MNTHPLSKPFPLGQTVITPNALGQLYPADVRAALQRHACGEWDDLVPRDKTDNELSMKEGFRLLSAYRDRKGTRFWVITAADRSWTRVLLSEDN